MLLFLFWGVLRWKFISFCSTFTHSFIQFFRESGEVLDSVLFVLSIDKQLINCFWKIRMFLRRASWCDLVQANLLIWADFAGWTGWEVLTVLDEWKIALVTVQVERVKNGCVVSIC